MKRKLLLLIALMAVGLSHTWAYDFSAVAPSGQTLYYNIVDGNAEVTYPGSSSSDPYWRFTKPTGELSIPLTVTDDNNGTTYSVTSIGDHAFYSCSGLTSVVIPNSVTSIGSSAFSNCSRLTYVTIPNFVTAIGDWAFSSCTGLTSVIISNSVIRIGIKAFYLCSSLTNVSIGNSVTTIEDDAFQYCSSLMSVDIPNSVTSIGNRAFHMCSSLTSVAIPNSVTSIGQSAFAGCSGLTSVIISNSLTIISGFAFSGCSSLTSVTIPNSVTSIGSRAFANCSGLTSLTIPNSVIKIWDGAFANCSGLTSVTIPNSVTTILSGAFENCSSLTNVTIPNSLTNLGSYVFSGTALYDNEDNWTNGVLYINNCLIEAKRNEIPSSYTVVNGTTIIAAGAFGNCISLTSVTIPNSVVGINDNTFFNCSSLTSVTIPNSVTSIGFSAFRDCSSLISVTVPNSVASIRDDSFYGCSGLTIFDLTDINNFTRTSCGTVKRVVKCSNHGTGENAIHRIPNTFSEVPSEDGVEYHIPASLILDNFIYQDNGSWKAKNIVLTDCNDAFEAPENFTADHVTYTRDLTDGNRSTLCLPFSADKPAGLDVYTFADYNSSTQTIRFQELQGSELTAYTPYLVGKNLSKSTTKFTFSKQNAVFPATPSPIATSTINGLTFHGTMNRECMNSSNYGYKDGYFVQSSAGTQGDHTSHAHVNPFRCFFTLGGSQSAPATLSVDTDGDYLGIDEVEGDMEQTSIRYSNDVYDMMGRLVRKDADNLRGLPRGIYIWRGKKQIAY